MKNTSNVYDEFGEGNFYENARSQLAQGEKLKW